MSEPRLNFAEHKIADDACEEADDIACMGLTKPEAGILATSPAIAPEITLNARGRGLRSHSTPNQPITAAAVAKRVATKALVGIVPEASALPTLKPNQAWALRSVM